MKKLLFATTTIFLLAVSAVTARADLDGFLSSLNIQAKVNMNDFGVKLSAQFGVPLPQVQAIIEKVELPSDAFMCLQLSQMTNAQPEMVVQAYKNNKGKGWGVIAQELGIKPGSAEFKALKRGDLQFSGERQGKTEKSHNKGKGKGHKK